MRGPEEPPAWAGPALRAVLDRAALTRAEAGARFPLFADPGTGTWTTTRRGAWTGGFWAGLLWLRARATGTAEDHRAAAECTARLAHWLHADTATRGLILWYGTASTGPAPPAATTAAPGPGPAPRDSTAAAARVEGAAGPGAVCAPDRTAAAGDRAAGARPAAASDRSAAPRVEGVPRAEGAPPDRPAPEPNPTTPGGQAAPRAERPAVSGHGSASDRASASPEPTPADGAPADAEALRAEAARVCLDALDPGLGLVPWGAAFGGPRLVARADAVPGLVPLLAAAGPRGAQAAAAHLHRHLDLCRAGAMAWRYVPGSGWRPLAEPAPGWSRGRAWLLLAVADGLAHAAGADPGVWRPERLRRAAARLGASPAPGEPLVPPADTAEPGGFPDTSAAAITAVALLKLAALPGADAGRLTRRATAVLHRLVSAHLRDGMLLDGCYDAATGTAQQHELIWGDYFLALGLALLTGLVRPGDV
ncbi:sugar ABC transporter permease [Streptomyces sp. MNP-20]|uniref:sugar ABC transporter permease n=1 Tax=Streptomyces sp. MNP-20 TaxID=2721165 RepID=UPI001C1DD460|nr:sugar ABC transporter permease [Streptomyces sp. MNP-20]